MPEPKVLALTFSDKLESARSWYSSNLAASAKMFANMEHYSMFLLLIHASL